MIRALLAGELNAGTPTIDAAEFAQAHVLSADDLATSRPVLGAPTLSDASAEPAAPRFQMDYDAYIRRRKEKEQREDQQKPQTYDEEIAVLLLAA